MKLWTARRPSSILAALAICIALQMTSFAMVDAAERAGVPYPVKTNPTSGGGSDCGGESSE